MPWTPALQELRPFLCLAAVALFCDEHRAPPCFFCKASSIEPKKILAPLEPSPLRFDRKRYPDDLHRPDPAISSAYSLVPADPVARTSPTLSSASP